MKDDEFKKALKKGYLGEKIIQEYLEKKGWIVYFPYTKNKAHYFDILATKNKEKAIAVDVKTKARLNLWPATGINIKSYNEYLNFIKKTNIQFYLIFIDDKSGETHCANLKKLKTCENIRPTNKIIAWYLKDMKYLFTIKKEKIIELSKYDQRNYPYMPIEMI